MGHAGVHVHLKYDNQYGNATCVLRVVSSQGRNSRLKYRVQSTYRSTHYSNTCALKALRSSHGETTRHDSTRGCSASHNVIFKGPTFIAIQIFRLVDACQVLTKPLVMLEILGSLSVNKCKTPSTQLQDRDFYVKPPILIPLRLTDIEHEQPLQRKYVLAPQHRTALVVQSRSLTTIAVSLRAFGLAGLYQSLSPIPTQREGGARSQTSEHNWEEGKRDDNFLSFHSRKSKIQQRIEKPEENAGKGENLVGLESPPGVRNEVRVHHPLERKNFRYGIRS